MVFGIIAKDQVFKYLGGFGIKDNRNQVTIMDYFYKWRWIDQATYRENIHFETLVFLLVLS